MVLTYKVYTIKHNIFLLKGIDFIFSKRDLCYLLSFQVVLNNIIPTLTINKALYIVKCGK